MTTSLTTRRQGAKRGSKRAGRIKAQRRDLKRRGATFAKREVNLLVKLINGRASRSDQPEVFDQVNSKFRRMQKSFTT